MEVKKFRPLRQPLTPEQQDQKLKDVAKLYEKQFLREMLKQMRATVTEGGFMPANQGEKIFREQLDQEYVEKWGDRGGIGLADMIHGQLRERLGPQLGIRPQPLRPIGPIKIEPGYKKSQPAGGSVVPAKEQNVVPSQEILKSRVDPERPGRLMMQLDLQNAGMGEAGTVVSPITVVSPWSGQLISSQKLSAQDWALEILHDDGLTSKMTFKGEIDPELKTAQNPQILAGQRIGILSPEAKSLFWTVSI